MANNKLLLIAALLLASCTSDPMAEQGDGGAKIPTESQKIINTSANAETGSLLVYFDDSAIGSIERSATAAMATRSVATRSGITSVDDVLSQIKVLSMTRLFPCDPRSEQRARAAGLHKWYELRFDTQVDLNNAATKLSAIAEVQNIQFNTKYKKTWDGKSTPLYAGSGLSTRADAQPYNDPELWRQWHYINRGDQAIAPTVRAGADINAEEAWKITSGSSEIIVAVVDEGIKYTHPDLAANMWVNTVEQKGLPGVDDDNNGYVDDIHGHNFATDGPISWTIVDKDGKGDSGHGTHVGGTVAAVSNNGIGVCGVAGGSGKNDGVRLMSCQVLSGPGGSTTAIIAKGIMYAAINGASIIQCSMGIDAGVCKNDNAYKKAAKAECDAIDFFIKTSNCTALDGGIVIFAAGNEATGCSAYPAALSDCISVTAFGPDFLPASYTNYGPGCNIAAPGGDYNLTKNTSSTVLSTMPSERNNGQDYGFMQGTSMACPHVSGVAALGLSYALQKGKHYTRAQFTSMLLTSVNDIECYLDGTKESNGTMHLEDYRKKMGTGTIDAYQLLMQIEGTPCLRIVAGAERFIPLVQFFGGSASNLTYISATMSAADMTKLGITTAPEMQYGKLKIKCTKVGSAKITIKAIAGGNAVGTDEEMGGMEITKEFAIISRGVQSENGGWL